MKGLHGIIWGNTFVLGETLVVQKNTHVVNGKVTVIRTMNVKMIWYVEATTVQEKKDWNGINMMIAVFRVWHIFSFINRLLQI